MKHRFLLSAFILLAFAAAVFASELIRRNLSWTMESGNDPIVQVTNESDTNKIMTLRILLGDSSYRYRADFEVPSGENRFIRIREVLDRLGAKYAEVKSSTSGILQVEYDGADRDIKTSTVNLNPKSGISTGKEPATTQSPVIRSVDPKEGAPSGGTVVTIVGENFDEATVVKFGGISTMHNLQSRGTLVAVTPPHAAGSVDVEVGNGKKRSVLPTAFRYVQDGPVILSLDPGKGPGKGGVRVTLQGRNFQSGAVVHWDGVAVPAQFQAPDIMTLIVPPGKSGNVSVEVINPDGRNFVLADAFSYQGLPQIISISPEMGNTKGGYTITVNGNNFQKGASILFNGRYGPTTFINSSALAAVVPPTESGIVDISVSNPDGETINSPQSFLVNDPPKIRSITADPNPIVRLTSTHIHVDAYDPEVDNLEYEYRIAGGPPGGAVIPQENGEAQYNSPNITGIAIIQVIVYDQYRAKDVSQVEIKIE